MILYTATGREQDKNTLYPREITVDSLKDFCDAVKYDNMCCKMKDSYRNNDNFIQCDGIMFDVDNTHTDDPDAWQTEAGISETFPVDFYILRSRNYMKEKRKTNAKTGEITVYEPREKWHIYMPLSHAITNPAEYDALMLNVQALYPYIDPSATDRARMFYGVETPAARFESNNICIDEYIAGLDPDELRQMQKDSITDFIARVKNETYHNDKGTRSTVRNVCQLLGINNPLEKPPEIVQSADELNWMRTAEQERAICWLEGWARDNNVPLGTRYRFNGDNHPNAIAICVPCPWEEEHSMTGSENETVIIIELSGQLDFLCRHSHGKALHWRDYRAKIESANPKHNQEPGNNAGEQEQAPALPIKLSNIEKKKPEWLVPGYIPLNAVTLIAADGGAGKTSIETSITAAVSTGTRPFLLGFPTVAEKERGETGSGANVLFLSGEDFAAYTLREKIEAAGGDGERVFIVDPTNPNIKQYCFGGDLLGKAIEEINPRLVVIDPLQSFLHEDVNMIARNQMRQAMIPVAKLAEEKNLSVLIAVHSNKRDAASGRNRVSDSSDIWDMARSVLMVGMTGEGNIRYVSHEKSNWGALSKTALFRISKDGIVEFLRYEDKKDADYQCEKRTQRTQERDAPKRKDAEEFILDVLKDAEENILSAGDLKSMARDEGISDATYREARKALEKNHQIKRRQEGRGKSKGVKVYYQLADGFNIHALELDPAADTPPDRPDTEGQLEEKP